MSNKRKLTDEEKSHIKALAEAQARAVNPDAFITVIVDDYIDGDGRVGWRTVAMSEKILDT